MTQKDVSLQGKCLCGDIQYSVNGPVYHSSACHCSQCRQWSGHHWASFTITADSLSIDQGEESIAWYPLNDTERGFCVICGSSLFWRHMQDSMNGIAISMGTIVGKSPIELDCHIYTDDKGDYYTISDNKKQFGGPPTR